MKVEIFESRDADKPSLTGEFSVVPRIGEYLSRDNGGYFQYWNIVEVWHREVATGVFQPCIRVELDD